MFCFPVLHFFLLFQLLYCSLWVRSTRISDPVFLDDDWQYSRTAFFHHGVLLFRGFEIREPLAFEEVALSLVSQLPSFETWRRPEKKGSNFSWEDDESKFRTKPHLLVGLEGPYQLSGSSLVISRCYWVFVAVGSVGMYHLAFDGLRISEK